jgi:hypothetical protein
MSIAFFPPPASPLPPAAEDASNLWELVYFSLGFHVEDDPATGYQLRQLCEALCAPYQPIYDLLREREGMKGWTLLFDPRICPGKWLPYLTQCVGVTPTPEMSEEQLRAEIQQPTGWRRGEPESIRIATRRTLKSVEDEELMVIIRARTPEVGHHYVRVLESQCPNPLRTERVVRENVPAWETLDFDAISGVTFADITAKFVTFGDLTAAFPTFKDLAEVLPTEL